MKIQKRLYNKLKYISDSMYSSPLLKKRNYVLYKNKLSLWSYMSSVDFPDTTIKKQYIEFLKDKSKILNIEQLDMGEYRIKRNLPKSAASEELEIDDAEYNDLVISYEEYLNMVEIINESGAEYNRYKILLDFEDFIKANYNVVYQDLYDSWKTDKKSK